MRYELPIDPPEEIKVWWRVYLDNGAEVEIECCESDIEDTIRWKLETSDIDGDENTDIINYECIEDELEEEADERRADARRDREFDGHN